MKKYFVMSVAVFCLHGLAEDADSSRRPQAIDLVRTKVRPARAIPVGEYIYFTDYKEVGQLCVGEGLYRYSLKLKQVETMGRIMNGWCIRGLVTDGESVWVAASQTTSQTQVSLFRWGERGPETLSQWLSELHPDKKARLDAELRRQRLHSSPVQLAHVYPGWLDLLLKLPIEETPERQTSYAIVSLPLSSTEASLHTRRFDLPSEEVAGGIFVDLARDGKGTLYFSMERKPAGQFGSVYVVPPPAVGGEKTGGVRKLGATEAIRVGDTDPVPSDRWGVRVPRFLTGLSGGGFLISDRDFLSPPSLSRYSPKADAFTRSLSERNGGQGASPDEEESDLPRAGGGCGDLGGIGCFRDGILVSHPYARKISWYGGNLLVDEETK